MADEKNTGSREGESGDRLSKSREIVQDYLTRREAGEDLDTEEFLRMYPELEEELRSLFEKIRDKVTSAKDLLRKPEDERDDREGSKILGDFRLLREIGSGGMATVYEAEQISLKRRVALKVLPSHLSFSDEAVRKFRREAEAGGRSTHSGIVAIYATGQHEGVHFIAEELVEDGYTLADRLEELRKEDRLPIGYLREAAKLMAEVADALQHAHASGVIHRDVKPSNILLTPSGQPKVTDFGLAKIEDALTLSRTGDFAGTPYYMSPEQAMSRRIGIDHRTDVYSLGVTLYETLVLKRPFDGETSHEVLKKIIFHEPRDPRKLNPRVPWDLAVICLKAMEKEPGRRYQTMEEFGEDLNRFINGEMIQARPANWTYKAWKRVKRNPIVSGAMGVAVIAVLCLIFYFFWAASQILEERKGKERSIEFLVEMLMSTDPGMAGKDVKMIDVLEYGQERLHDTFRDLPRIEAELLNTFGYINQNLGRYAEGESLHKRAWEIRRDLLGEKDRETFESLHDMGSAILRQGRYSEAEAIFLEVLDAWRLDPGEEDDDTLKCRNNLAVALIGLGRHSDAEAIQREVVEARERIWGKDDTETLTAMNTLAGVLVAQGKLEEAEKYYEEVLEIRRSISKEDHPGIYNSLNNLGYLRTRQGRYGEAESLFLEALEGQRLKLGIRHRDTIDTMNNLANLLIDTGRVVETLPLYREMVDGCRAVYGQTHPTTLRVISRLAHLYLDQKRIWEVEGLVSPIIHVVDELLPPDNLDRAMINLCYARCLLAETDNQDKHDEAEPYMIAWFEGVEAAYGAGHFKHLKACKEMINFYMEGGKPEQAAEYEALQASLK